MKAYGGNRDIALLILNLGARRERVLNNTPRPLSVLERTPVLLEQGVWWALDPVWVVCRTENLVPSPGFDPPDRPAPSLLTIPTTPCRILPLQRRLRQGIHIFSADYRLAAQKRIAPWSADHTQRCAD